MVRPSELRTYRCSHRPAHGCHPAHADIVEGFGSHPKLRDITSASACIVNRNGLVRVDHLHQVMHRAVPIGRHGLVSKRRLPFPQPLGSDALNLCHHIVLDATFSRPEPIPHGFDQVAQC